MLLQNKQVAHNLTNVLNSNVPIKEFHKVQILSLILFKRVPEVLKRNNVKCISQDVGAFELPDKDHSASNPSYFIMVVT